MEIVRPTWQQWKRWQRVLTLAGLTLGSVFFATIAAAQNVYTTPYYFTTLAGSGAFSSVDGPAATASFKSPAGIAIDSAGNVFVAEFNGPTIRKISASGIVTTFAGSAGSPGFADGLGTAARFRQPLGVALDAFGNLFVVDTGNQIIRKISPAGVVSTFAGQPGISGSTDGAGNVAQFKAPAGVTLDAAGNLYIGDSSNSAVRKITPAAVVSTFAGMLGIQGSTDGTGTAARFNSPSGISMDPTGNLFVTEPAAATIRKITPAAVVTTFAGLAGSRASTDATGTAARFNFPQGVAVDASGNIFVADADNHTIRKITPAGVVTTVAGSAGVSGSTDGLGQQATFNAPRQIAVDRNGNIYVADVNNGKIRRSVFPPVIALQPASQNVNAGANVVLTANSPSDMVTFQWRKNGVAISGATTNTLALNNVQISDAANYTLLATNVAGSISSNVATLNVNVPVNPPTTTTQPVTQTVTVGSPVQFNYNATAVAGTTLQWRKNGVPIAGATTGTFSISSATLPDAGTYTLAITNAGGTAISNAAILIVVALSPPTITVQPVSQSVVVGTTVQFVASATSATAMTFQWRKNGATIGGATEPVLRLNSVSAAEAGIYTVVVSNGGGTVTSNAASLTVSSVPAIAPTFVSQPTDQAVALGDLITLGIAVTGTAPLSIQWFKNGTAVPGATSELFSIVSTQPSDAGSYSVVVTNSVGSTASRAAGLSVITAPTITTSPAAQAVTVGNNVQLFVGVAGTSPFGYEWRKDGVAIPDATISVFALNSVQLTDAGGYSVTVTNPAGSVTSQPATLTVNPAGPTSRLSNVSIRTAMAAGQTVILGLAVEGGARDILVRGVGPSLSRFGVAGFMVDPRIELFRGQTLVVANDDWPAMLEPVFTNSGAFGLTSASRDAAFQHTMNGAFSIQARGTGAGIVLLEVYDVGELTAPRLVNVSARNRVGTGDDLLIAGFNVTGAGTKQLLIRAIGPGLAAFGVPGTLLDPKLELYNSAGVKLNENDDWAPSLAPTFGVVAAFGLPAGSRDAALLTTLPPGSFTVQVRGSDGGTGEALVEVYEVP